MRLFQIQSGQLTAIEPHVDHLRFGQFGLKELRIGQLHLFQQDRLRGLIGPIETGRVQLHIDAVVRRVERRGIIEFGEAAQLGRLDF